MASRVRWRRVLMLAGVLAASATAQARGAWLPLGEGLLAADTVVVARVLESKLESGGESAELRVLAVLKGALDEERIQVSATSGIPGRPSLADPQFRKGRRLLAFLTRTPAGLSLLPVPHRATLALGDDEPTLDEIRGLIAGYLEALRSAEAEPEAVKLFLASRVGVGEPRLRSLVLGDLAPRLGPGDLPWLTGLFSDRSRPDPVRVWAVTQVGVIGPAVFPAEISNLLDSRESFALRRAVMAAYSGRKHPEDLPVIVLGLEDPDARVRHAAILAMGSPEAVSPLRDRFSREPELAVKLAIVRRLAVIASPDARAALRAILEAASDPQLAKTTRRAIELAESLAESR